MSVRTTNIHRKLFMPRMFIEDIGRISHQKHVDMLFSGVWLPMRCLASLLSKEHLGKNVGVLFWLNPNYFSTTAGHTNVDQLVSDCSFLTWISAMLLNIVQRTTLSLKRFQAKGCRSFLSSHGSVFKHTPQHSLFHLLLSFHSTTLSLHSCLLMFFVLQKTWGMDLDTMGATGPLLGWADSTCSQLSSTPSSSEERMPLRRYELRCQRKPASYAGVYG